MKILVLNAGSSSFKARLYESRTEKVLAWGAVQAIGGSGTVAQYGYGEEALVEKSLPGAGYTRALDFLLEFFNKPGLGATDSRSDLAAVGHRVVHSLGRYKDPVLASQEVLSWLESCAKWAPLHNPISLRVIRECQARMPGIPQICVLDDGFHQNLPEYAYRYGLPLSWMEKRGYRKIGFHGTAFRSMLECAFSVLGPEVARMKVILLMLGSGSTACAWDRGRSVDVSTGLTPLEGLPQTTRVGDIDPGVLLELIGHHGRTARQLREQLYRESGLLGLSGLSENVGELLAAAENGHSGARLALDFYVYRIRKYVGAYAAALRGVDLLIFGGGIAERAPQLRQAIASGFEYLGLLWEPDRNRRASPQQVLSHEESRVKVLLAEVNEELVIARDVRCWLEGNHPACPE